jgi:DNA polymerase-1
MPNCPAVATIDFETKGIARRPNYPPRPVGVSIILPGSRSGTYYAWGHPNGKNNCTLSQAKARLKDLWNGKVPLLFQNAKFDLDVAEVHMGLKLPPWQRVHDTLYLLFLLYPHSKTLSLKPMSEEILGMKPEEQDKVKNWVLAHKAEIEAKYGRFTPKDWGQHISEAPVEIVAPYAVGDTVRTLRLFKKLYPIVQAQGMGGAYDRERQLMPIMLRNEREGIRIDQSVLNKDIEIYQEAMSKSETWLRKRLKAPDLELDKDRQVGDALEKAGVVTDFVMTPTGQKSVSKANLTIDLFKDKRVFYVLGYRNRLNTALGTFMQPWAEAIARTGGILHTNWNQVKHTEGKQAGSRTGRMSCSPNFMNIPTEWDGKGDGYEHPTMIDLPPLPLVRQYVLPDDRAHVFAGRDYDQQELRILAHFEDGPLLAAYNANPRMDIHAYVQQAIANVIGTVLPRKAVKILNFGTIYGMGLGKLAIGMNTDIDHAKQVMDARRAAMPGVRDLEKTIKLAARNDEPIVTWGGRLYYKEPSIVLNGRRIDFGYKLLNYLIQGSAADCTKQAVINYDAICRDGRFMVQVHDEVNISVPKKAAKQELKILGEAMAAVAFDLPMTSTPKLGPNWAAIKEYEE